MFLSHLLSLTYFMILNLQLIFLKRLHFVFAHKIPPSHFLGALETPTGSQWPIFLTHEDLPPHEPPGVTSHLSLSSQSSTLSPVLCQTVSQETSQINFLQWHIETISTKVDDFSLWLKRERRNCKFISFSFEPNMYVAALYLPPSTLRHSQHRIWELKRNFCSISSVDRVEAGARRLQGVSPGHIKNRTMGNLSPSREVFLVIHSVAFMGCSCPPLSHQQGLYLMKCRQLWPN